MAKIEISPNSTLYPKIELSWWHEMVSRVVQRTFWTSLRCNMQVWTPTGTKAPNPLATLRFCLFFRKVFNKSIHLGNKKSAYVDQTFFIRKLSLRTATKKHIYVFFIRPIFFSIPTRLCFFIASGTLKHLTFIFLHFVFIETEKRSVCVR